MKLERRNIVITGGTAGIGRELVRMLHADNDILVIASNTPRLEALARDIPGVLTCPADLSRHREVEAAAREVRARFKHLDVLINNAAVQYTPALLDDDFQHDSIRREIAINFTAVCSLTALLMPALLHDNAAAILNVNSGLALMPKTNSAVYCATKAAVNAFSQSLRNQLEGTNVRVLQAFMPLVETQMSAGRGIGKLSAADAARLLVRGVEHDVEDHDIGKVRLLRALVRFAPGIARNIIKAA